MFRAGEPISQLVIGRLLSAGFDRVITFEPHLHRARNLGQVFQCRAESLSAAPLIARWIKDRRWSGGVLVGPDQESESLVSEVVNLAGLDFIVGFKHRLGDRSVKVSFKRSVRASGAVVVDDVASSGTTLIAVIQALRRMRVRVIDVVVAHPLFEPGALARLRAAGARRIVSCNSIRHSTNGIEIAPVLAQALTDLEK